MDGLLIPLSCNPVASRPLIVLVRPVIHVSCSKLKFTLHFTTIVVHYQFTLVHVAGKEYGLDGLSRRRAQDIHKMEQDEKEKTEVDDWIDQIYEFMHFLNPTL